MSNLKCKSMRKIHFFDKKRYLEYIVLLLLFYPLNILGAQGVISVKGQAMSIKEDAAMYFERYGDVQVISVAETEPEQMEIGTRDY